MFYINPQIWFANEFVSVVCQNPINWNFLLENPQVPYGPVSFITCPGPVHDQDSLRPSSQGR